jgi:predicted enzyme related to lactoylglutathione lyase
MVTPEIGEMKMSIRYTHTNIVAKDWRKLADFYMQVFGCLPVPPERDLSGEWLEKLTAIPDCKIKGVHLALPGYENGPTLEIFSFEPQGEQPIEKLIHRMGYGHLAFHVDDVQQVLDDLLAHGGTTYGEVVKKMYPVLGELTAVYACDPEGNIIEIQNWNRDALNNQ